MKVPVNMLRLAWQFAAFFVIADAQRKYLSKAKKVITGCGVFENCRFLKKATI